MGAFFGGGRSRNFRFIALGGVLLAGALLHGHGTSYALVRGFYYVVLFGLVGTSIFGRSRGRRSAMGGGTGPWRPQGTVPPSAPGPYGPSGGGVPPGWGSTAGSGGTAGSGWPSGQGRALGAGGSPEASARQLGHSAPGIPQVTPLASPPSGDDPATPAPQRRDAGPIREAEGLSRGDGPTSGESKEHSPDFAASSAPNAPAESSPLESPGRESIS